MKERLVVQSLRDRETKKNKSHAVLVVSRRRKKRREWKLTENAA